MVFFSVYSIVVHHRAVERPETPDSFRVQFPSRQFHLLPSIVITNPKKIRQASRFNSVNSQNDGWIENFDRKKNTSKYPPIYPSYRIRRFDAIHRPRDQRYNQHLTDKYDNKCTKCQ